MMSAKIDENAIVVADNQQVFGDLPDGNAVILDLNNGVYYGLNAVGGRIWSLIQEPISFIKLRDALIAEYDVEYNQCTAELKSMLDEMNAQGLIQTKMNNF